MKRHLVAAAVIVFALSGLTTQAQALFGFGDVVFDPSNYANAVQQLLQMQRQYDQVVNTYRTVRAQYDHWVRMARTVPVEMRSRYRTAATPWTWPSSSNTYGTTGDWSLGVQTGEEVARGYKAATRALQTYGTVFKDIPQDQRARITTDYASVELTDGTNLQTLELIGRLRANAGRSDETIRNLEDDTLSSDPGMNTEIAVLNKINAANVIAVRNIQDTNKLLVSLAEAQVLRAKRERDAETDAINQHIRFRAEGKAALAAPARGWTETARAWRMP